MSSPLLSSTRPSVMLSAPDTYNVQKTGHRTRRGCQLKNRSHYLLTCQKKFCLWSDQVLGGKYQQQSTSSKVKLNQVPTEWRTAGLLADKFHSRRAGTSTPWNSCKTWQTNDGISINWRHHPEGHSREAKEQTMIFRGRTKAPTGKGKLLATSK